MRNEKGERLAQSTVDAGTDPGTFAFVTRQPIFGPAMTVIAHELLYKESVLAGGVPVLDASEATLRIVADAALEVGLDRLAAGLPVHINYPRELLVGGTPPSMLPERVVIEVVQDIPHDPSLAKAIRELRARGHRVALDDYSPRFNDPGLLDEVDIIKIDVSQEDPIALDAWVPELKKRGLMLIAQEVETIEQFEHCISIGFEGFQGDFLHSPETFSARRVPFNRLGALRLLAALQNDDYSIQEVEQLVSQDVAISYRVLRCINSSYYNLPRTVESIRQAIVILGLDNLRQLCTLVALQGIGERPPALYVTAMTRARMCEQLGRLAGAKDLGPYFITGLFSLLNVIVGAPTPEVLENLPLSTPIVRALLEEEGELGAALKCVRAYERGQWHRVSFAGVAPNLIRAAYIDAVFWAEEARAMFSR